MIFGKIRRGAAFVVIVFALSGPWAIAYNGAPHGIIYSNGNYGVAESILWSAVVGVVFYINYKSLLEAVNVKNFILKSAFTASCMSLLLMMDWGHSMLTVLSYVIWCFVCGALAYAMHNYSSRLNRK